MLIALALATAAQAMVVALPAWMAGCWETKVGDEWTEECWTAPRAGIMLGNGRSGTGGVLKSWELMQIELIETDDPAIDPLTFYGAPQGKDRTAFGWDRRRGPGPGVAAVAGVLRSGPSATGRRRSERRGRGPAARRAPS